jgi:LPXTG-motif cell wall-anchored protein
MWQSLDATFGARIHAHASGGLPVTGASAGGAAAIGLALIGGGAALLLRRRRRFTA